MKIFFSGASLKVAIWSQNAPKYHPNIFSDASLKVVILSQNAPKYAWGECLMALLSIIFELFPSGIHWMTLTNSKNLWTRCWSNFRGDIDHFWKSKFVNKVVALVSSANGGVTLLLVPQHRCPLTAGPTKVFLVMSSHIINLISYIPSISYISAISYRYKNLKYIWAY